MTDKTYGRKPHQFAKLTKRPDFLRIQARNQRFKGSYLVVLAGEGAGRVGFTVSRKVGGAVVRNRVRRRLHEIFRQLGTDIPQRFDYVVIAYPRAATVGMNELRQDALCLIEKIQKNA